MQPSTLSELHEPIGISSDMWHKFLRVNLFVTSRTQHQTDGRVEPFCHRTVPRLRPIEKFVHVERPLIVVGHSTGSTRVTVSLDDRLSDFLSPRIDLSSLSRLLFLACLGLGKHLSEPLRVS